jgi:hypothetical protein
MEEEKKYFFHIGSRSQSLVCRVSGDGLSKYVEGGGKNGHDLGINLMDRPSPSLPRAC